MTFLERSKEMCIVFCVFMFLFLIDDLASSSFYPKECDSAVAVSLAEGNIGESSHFPWIGILRVHIHENNDLKIALTGIVLIGFKYAIGNADDIAKIPKKVFNEDTKAMFIVKDGEPWYASLESYVTHPEYEFSTYNTIALIELRVDEQTIPIKPICLPHYSYNASNHLYAIGYTDDRKLLEKVIHRLDYVDQSTCDEFYKRTQILDVQFTPTQFQCGYAINSKENCIWDNGMVMASNSTGIWTLIGLGVQGPGCAAPSRFIDLFPYLPWISTATEMEDMDYGGFRRQSGQATFDFKSNKTLDPKQLADGLQNFKLLGSESEQDESVLEIIKDLITPNKDEIDINLNNSEVKKY